MRGNINRALVREVNPNLSALSPRNKTKVTDTRERSLRSHTLRGRLMDVNYVAYDQYRTKIGDITQLPKEIDPN